MTVGGIAIITIIVSTLNCYVKTNGSLNWGTDCQDKAFVDDDEIEIKTVELGGVHVMYVENKHPVDIESERDEE